MPSAAPPRPTPAIRLKVRRQAAPALLPQDAAPQLPPPTEPPGPSNQFTPAAAPNPDGGLPSGGGYQANCISIGSNEPADVPSIGRHGLGYAQPDIPMQSGDEASAMGSPSVNGPWGSPQSMSISFSGHGSDAGSPGSVTGPAASRDETASPALSGASDAMQA